MRIEVNITEMNCYSLLRQYLLRRKDRNAEILSKLE